MLIHVIVDFMADYDHDEEIVSTASSLYSHPYYDQLKCPQGNLKWL